MPLYTDALLSDAGDLPNALFGAYVRLLCRWWREGAAPEQNEKRLARWAGLSSIEFEDLKEFLTDTPEGWIQKKLRETFTAQQEKSAKARSSANARWNNANASKKGCKRSADGNADDMLSMNHEPSSLSKDKQKGAQKRATRLPEDFALPSKWREWAKSKGFSDQQIDTEFEKMRTGSQYAKNGACRDWYRRWQNWLSDKAPATTPGPSVDSDPLLKGL